MFSQQKQKNKNLCLYLTFFLVLFAQSQARINLLYDELEEQQYNNKLGFSIWDIFENKYEKEQNIQTSCQKIEGVQKINEDQKFNYSGYLNINDYSKSLLGFTFYGSQKAQNIEQIQNYPVVIFLNGGPGSSSQIGNLEELGPLKLVLEYDTYGDIKQVKNPYTWSTEYSLLFVDQPVGTGMSYAETIDEIPQNMEDVSQDFLKGLNQLFENQNGCFNQLGISKNIPIFITGESYAGKYIPAIAQAMIKYKSVYGFNLKGIAIGDAFTDPIAISEKYGEYALKQELINEKQQKTIQEMFVSMKSQYENKDFKNANYMYNSIIREVKKYSKIKDIYNYKSNHKQNDLTEQFFENKDNQLFYNIDQTLKFNKQSDDVYKQLGGDFLKQDCFERLQEVIDSGIQVLVFNGRNDFIVCEDCTINWFDKLLVNGQNLEGMELQTWFIKEGIVAGQEKHMKNLQLLLIDDAGHLVPQDQPKYALEMIKQFVNKSIELIE